MSRWVITSFLLFALWHGHPSQAAPLRFEKISDHCYYLQSKDSGGNIIAVVTDEGILVVDPPSEPDLSPMVEALRRLSSKPVRWVVFSNPLSARSGGGKVFAEQGAVLLGGTKQRALSVSLAAADPAGDSTDLSTFPWVLFDNQIHLYPSNIEIRIMALQHKAATGGDVIVHVPADKVLLIGKVYQTGLYPEIDTATNGDAYEWVDGLKQVVDSIPVLKPAIPPAKIVPLPKTAPQAKAESNAEAEKTLEEGIIVLPAYGEISNLQNVKDLLGVSQKLRADAVRAVKARRSCENFISSSRVDAYRIYGNFSTYALQLCESAIR